MDYVVLILNMYVMTRFTAEMLLMKRRRRVNRGIVRLECGNVTPISVSVAVWFVMEIRPAQMEKMRTMSSVPTGFVMKKCGNVAMENVLKSGKFVLEVITVGIILMRIPTCVAGGTAHWNHRIPCGNVGMASNAFNTVETRLLS